MSEQPVNAEDAAAAAAERERRFAAIKRELDRERDEREAAKRLAESAKEKTVPAPDGEPSLAATFRRLAEERKNSEAAGESPRAWAARKFGRDPREPGPSSPVDPFNPATLRARSNLFRREAGANLADVEYPRRRLRPPEFARYLAVRDELSALLRFPGTIVLCGANGPGKTMLAAGLTNAFSDAGRPAYYCTAKGYYRTLGDTFDAPGRAQTELYQRMSGLKRSGSGRRLGYELLTIDELEVQPAKQWHVDELRELINARYGEMVSTLLITNLTPQQINGSDHVESAAYFNTAVLDRIQQVGRILVCDWPSLREGQWPGAAPTLRLTGGE